jgi:hypothetical protein
MRNLETIFIEQGYIENDLQVVVIVRANIGICAVWFKKSVSLLPNTNCMRFNAGKV